MGLLSGLFGDSDADKARKLQKKQIEAQFKYDTERYEFDQQRANKAYRHQLDGLRISRENERLTNNFNYKTQLQSAQYNEAIRKFTQESQLRQYKQSEKIYQRQIKFNKNAERSALDASKRSMQQLGRELNAAGRAVTAEQQRMQDVLAEQAYQKQDLFLSLLQEEGMQVARGVSGKSASKGLQSAIAQYGRNQAILADSLVSAQRQYQGNLRDIGFGMQETRFGVQEIRHGMNDIRQARYGADMAAHSNRMLRPLSTPQTPMPFRTPEAILQRPMRPGTPPRPIRGAVTVPGGNTAQTIGGGLLNAGLSVGMGALTAAAAGNPFTAPLAIASFLGGLF